MLVVKERENIIIEKAAKAKETGRKIYIYGAGVGGRAVFDSLCKNNIMPDGFCVDLEYYKEDSSFCGLPIISINSIGGVTDEMYSVIIACMKKEYSCKYNNVEFIHVDPVSLWPSFRIDFSFIDQNRKDFEKTYEELEDGKSKECMEAYLNQRISGKMEYLEHLWIGNEYYDRELIVLKNISCIVDCGAYDGDTFFSFCENYEQATGHSYKGKAFLLEPDENNYQRLSDRNFGKENVIIKKLGAWEEKKVLHFDRSEGNPLGGKISEKGEISIAVDKIDNIVSEQDKVDFIKMDIEGSELNALKGAKHTIKNHCPILAICVYHKKEDLITIPQYIKSLCPNYKLYLRAHDRFSHELVLYALPYEIISD